MSLTPVISATRTSGVGPLAITFNGLSTTSTNQSDIFRNILYYWVFGDAAGSPVSGTTWAYGSLPGLSSRNTAWGPVAAHCFENPGSFTVTLWAWDGTEWNSTTIGITVIDPDIFYASPTGSTICFENTTTGTGGPAGCTYVTTSSWATIMSNMATNRRLLLKKGGDIFDVASTQSIAANGPWTVGAYGSGANPILRATANNVVCLAGPAASGSTQRSDGRWMDLQIDPNGHTGVYHGRHTDVPDPNTVFDRLLYLRTVSIGQTFHGIFNFGAAETYIIDTVIDCDNYGVFLYADSGTPDARSDDCAVLGSSIRNDPAAGPNQGHTLRLIFHHRFVMADTDVIGGQAFQYLVKMAGREGWIDATSYTEHVVISRNKLTAENSGSAVIMALQSVNSTTDYRLRRIIVDGNHFITANTTGNSMNVGDGNTFCIRNNLYDQSVIDTGAGFSAAVNIFKFYSGGSPMPDDYQVYNNTYYSSRVTAAGTVPVVVRFSNAATNVLTRDNLMYTPNATNSVMLSGTAGAGEAHSNNTSDANTDAVDPLFVGGGSAAINFKLLTGSPYIGFGTSVPVYQDAFGNWRNAVTNDAGFHQFNAGTDPFGGVVVPPPPTVIPRALYIMP